MTKRRQRTKIVATLGPASNSEETIGDLIDAGVDVFRINFSHGSADGHARDIARVRKISAEKNRRVAVLQDLQGVKVRTTVIEGSPFQLETGSTVLVAGGDEDTTPDRIFVSPGASVQDLKTGDQILINDGRLRLVVRNRRQDEWLCEVVVGGLLEDRKGVNLPDTPTRDLPALTPKDLRDLEVGVREGVDLIALSFVRSAHDVQMARQALAALDAHIPVIAKIEKPEAIADIRNILGESFGIMVARGDLGVELSPQKVPVAQKRLIAEARRFKKPVITATQMLESMIDAPIPTRAEASDIANAVFDGTDAIMLSAETAVGKYPVETVKMAASIAAEVEAETLRGRPTRAFSSSPLPTAEATGEAAVIAGESVGAQAIVIYTQSGSTAHVISGGRPTMPMHVFGSDERVLRLLAVAWGIESSPCESTPASLGELINVAESVLLREKVVVPGVPIVIVGGHPFGHHGNTNLLTIHVVRDRR